MLGSNFWPNFLHYNLNLLFTLAVTSFSLGNNRTIMYLIWLQVWFM